MMVWIQLDLICRDKSDSYRSELIMLSISAPPLDTEAICRSRQRPAMLALALVTEGTTPGWED